MKKLLLFGTLVFGLNAFCQVPSYVPTSGLIGWWPFNGNANDESGNGNNGSVNGATSTNDRMGNPNSAYDFDGNDDFIEISSLTSVEGVSEMSFSGWVKLDTITTAFMFFNGQLGVANSRMVLSLGDHYCNDDMIRMTMHQSGNDNGSGKLPDFIQIDSLYHIVMTFNGNGAMDSDKLKMYVNGVEESLGYESSNTCSPATLETLTQGAGVSWFFGSSNSNQLVVDGVLDDFGIWNRELTQCEVTELYTTLACNVGLDNLVKGNKELIKVIDLMGRETTQQKNKVQIYIYSDGSTERVFDFE